MSEQQITDPEVSVEEVPEGHGLMSMLTPRHGDLRVMWDRNNAAETGAARQTFERMISEGHIAYRAVGKQGDRGEVITVFDPDAERIIMVRQNRGG